MKVIAEDDTLSYTLDEIRQICAEAREVAEQFAQNFVPVTTEVSATWISISDTQMHADTAQRAGFDTSEPGEYRWHNPLHMREDRAWSQLASAHRVAQVLEDYGFRLAVVQV